MKTIQYLQACNKLFEGGILGKRVFIKDMSSPILTGMEEGYCFFATWLDEKISQGMYNYQIWLMFPNICMHFVNLTLTYVL